MIVAFVQIPLPAPLSEAAASRLFEGTAPFYRDLPGLCRKHYILSHDGRVAGGLYFWRDRAVAEHSYDEQRHRRVRELYGAEPQIAWFSNLVMVDNEGIRR